MTQPFAPEPTSSSVFSVDPDEERRRRLRLQQQLEQAAPAVSAPQPQPQPQDQGGDFLPPEQLTPEQAARQAAIEAGAMNAPPQGYGYDVLGQVGKVAPTVDLGNGETFTDPVSGRRFYRAPGDPGFVALDPAPKYDLTSAKSLGEYLGMAAAMADPFTAEGRQARVNFFGGRADTDPLRGLSFQDKVSEQGQQQSVANTRAALRQDFEQTYGAIAGSQPDATPAETGTPTVRLATPGVMSAAPGEDTAAVTDLRNATAIARVLDGRAEPQYQTAPNADGQSFPVVEHLTLADGSRVPVIDMGAGAYYVWDPQKQEYVDLITFNWRRQHPNG